MSTTTPSPARPAQAPRPLVLLVQPKGSRHKHAELVANAGFRVIELTAEDVDVARVLARGPAVVAAELDGAASTTLNLARQFRQNPATRLIPFIIYGHQLSARDIEDAARAGVLWLQLEPTDGARLAAAVRGLIAASRRDNI